MVDEVRIEQERRGVIAAASWQIDSCRNRDPLFSLGQRANGGGWEGNSRLHIHTCQGGERKSSVIYL
jgi:hypothetical protein